MPKTLIPKLALAAVLALAVSGLAISAAPAKNTVEINSRLILRSNTPAFHGKVESPKEACVDNRLVKLFKKKSSAGDRKLLGKTHTDEDGNWEVIVNRLSTGSYWAVVNQREEGTAGTTFVCLRDKSKTARID